MAYELSWFTPDKVIYLEIKGHPKHDELNEINEIMTEILDKGKNKVSLVINATEMKTGYQTSDHLRDTQTYMDHIKLHQVFFISSNKLNRLICLMAFNLSRARLVQCNTLQIVVEHLKRQGFHTTSGHGQ